jgi:hypothetical protein
VSTFRTVTVAPGTAAPVLSVTVPLMSPEFVLWASRTGLTSISASAINEIADQNLFIVVPPGKYFLQRDVRRETVSVKRLSLSFSNSAPIQNLPIETCQAFFLLGMNTLTQSRQPLALP